MLLDLATVTEEALRTAPLTPQMRVALLTIKIVPAQPPFDHLFALVAELRAIRLEPGGEQFVIGLLTFVYSYSPGKAARERLQLLAQEVGMTILDVFRDEGIAEGRTEGRTEMLLELLEQKFGSLPDWVPGTVKAGSHADLKTWGSRVLTAATLADIFR